jgi:hypothetical protein
MLYNAIIIVITIKSVRGAILPTSIITKEGPILKKHHFFRFFSFLPTSLAGLSMLNYHPITNIGYY